MNKAYIVSYRTHMMGDTHYFGCGAESADDAVEQCFREHPYAEGVKVFQEV